MKIKKKFNALAKRSNLLSTDVLGEEAKLKLELLDNGDGEIDGAPRLAALHRLEVVLVTLAAAVVEKATGAVRWFKVISGKNSKTKECSITTTNSTHDFNATLTLFGTPSVLT